MAGIPITRSWLLADGANLAAFFVCLGLLGFGYYLQFVEGLAPCPLCILQRVAFLLLGLIFLAAALHRPASSARRWYVALLALTAGTGAVIAGRHVYLQSLPPEQAPACGADLGYMLANFPLHETIVLIFRGTGDCASVAWRFLGLSIPGWALVWFVALGVAGVMVNLGSSVHRRPAGF